MSGRIRPVSEPSSKGTRAITPTPASCVAANNGLRGSGRRRCRSPARVSTTPDSTSAIALSGWWSLIETPKRRIFPSRLQLLDPFAPVALVDPLVRPDVELLHVDRLDAEVAQAGLGAARRPSRRGRPRRRGRRGARATAVLRRDLRRDRDVSTAARTAWPTSRSLWPVAVAGAVSMKLTPARTRAQRAQRLVVLGAEPHALADAPGAVAEHRDLQTGLAERPLFIGSSYDLDVEVAGLKAPKRRSQSNRYISVPRAAVMSPRSTIRCAGQPKLSSSVPTCALAPASLPQMKTSWSPGTRAGSTITRQFSVFNAFTTRAPEGALDLLAERVVVADAERRRSALGEVERVPRRRPAPCPRGSPSRSPRARRRVDPMCS